MQEDIKKWIAAWDESERERILVLQGSDALRGITESVEERYDTIVVVDALSMWKPEELRENLRLFQGMLSECGHLLLLEYNRLGLKFFAGAPEPFTQEYFLNLSNYNGKERGLTFSRDEWRNLLNECGIPYRFYYPYPDHYLPEEVFSDDTINDHGYGRPVPNHQGIRYELYNEQRVAHSLSSAGLMQDFSNSFMIELYPGDKRTDYAKYSIDRKKEFQIVTKIKSDPAKGRWVEKAAFGEESRKHIMTVLDNSQKTNAIPLLPAKKESDTTIAYDFLTLQNIESKLNDATIRKDREECLGYFDAVYQLLSGEAEMTERYTPLGKEVLGIEDEKVELCLQPANIDLIFDNIFLKEGLTPQELHADDLLVIDGEWIFDMPVPVAFIFWRSLSEVYARHPLMQDMIDFDELCARYQIRKDDMVVYQKWNRYFTLTYIGAGKDEEKACRPELLSLNDIRWSKGPKRRVIASLYWSLTGEFSDEQVIRQEAEICGDYQYKVRFSLESLSGKEQLRVDLQRGYYCKCKVVKTEGIRWIYPRTKDVKQDGFCYPMYKENSYRLAVEEGVSEIQISYELYPSTEELAEWFTDHKQSDNADGLTVERPPVDVIIPVYNAYEELRSCMESIRCHTDLKKDRIILINDKSPDERILPYLRSQQEENVVVLDNDRNLGFSNNVNKGMRYSDDRDVILLNSDTIVTSEWIDKIWRCAYSAKEIGTVTPLSNSATLCSLPVFCQDNPLPPGMTPEQMNRIVERCSIREYPRITVAVGFCMFIKREVIRDIGFFDAETFEKGYGEENDYCNRAEQVGYIHVMCDDTFIYHKGTASFVDAQKQQLKEDHERILQKRYASQMERNMHYCMNDPHRYIRENVAPYLDLHNQKKNLLYLVHQDFRKEAADWRGGTQAHVRDLTDGLKDEYNIFAVGRDREYLHLTIYIGQITHSYRFFIGKPSEFFQFHDARIAEILSAILDGFCIEIVHVHHMMGLSADIFSLAKERGLQLLFTIHDFYTIMPIVTCLDADDVYMDTGEDIDEDRLRKALRKRKNIAETVDILPKWQNEMRALLTLCDRIVVPYDNARGIICEVYPEIKEKIRVIPHGTEIDTKKWEQIAEKDVVITDRIVFYLDSFEEYDGIMATMHGWAYLQDRNSEEVCIYAASDAVDGIFYAMELERYDREDVVQAFSDERYRTCGFRGQFVYRQQHPKACHLILKADGKFYRIPALYKFMRKTYPETRLGTRRIAFLGGLVPEKGSRLAYKMITGDTEGQYEWFVIGNIGDEELWKLQQPNYYKLGVYDPQNLSLILQNLKIDVICILSVWPETFCYTLSEAVLCNVPVLGTDIGAVGERIKKNGYGWTVDAAATAEDIRAKLDQIFADPEKYLRVKNRTYDFREKSKEEMLQEYKELYTSIEGAAYCWKDHFDSRLLLSGKLCGQEYVYQPNRQPKLDEAVSDKDETALTKEEMIEALQRELTAIKSSRSYRLAKKLSQIRHLLD